MNKGLTQLYMSFLNDALLNSSPTLWGKGHLYYCPKLYFADKEAGCRSVIEVTGDGPRSLSFRLADIIKYHREKLWTAPSFIVPVAGEGICITDNITLGSHIGLGELAEKTAMAVSIFLENYLIKG